MTLSASRDSLGTTLTSKLGPFHGPSKFTDGSVFLLISIVHRWFFSPINFSVWKTCLLSSSLVGEYSVIETDFAYFLQYIFVSDTLSTNSS